MQYPFKDDAALCAAQLRWVSEWVMRKLQSWEVSMLRELQLGVRNAHLLGVQVRRSQVGARPDLPIFHSEMQCGSSTYADS